MCPSKTGTKPKVCQFNMSTCINQDIIWFDISMNESQIMNTFYSTCNFGDVKPENKEYVYQSILFDKMLDIYYPFEEKYFDQRF